MTPSTPSARRRGRRLVYRLAAILVAVGVWQLFAAGPGASSDFPSPAATARSAADLVTTGEYWSNIGHSVTTALIGLAVAIVGGLVIGLLIGVSPAARRSTQLLLDFGRTVPAIALLPLFLLLFGATRQLGVVLILVSAVWPVVIQTSYAVGQISPQLKVVARAYHLTRWHRLRYVVAPSMLPFVFAGLRIAATLSLLMAISSEFLGGSDGIGYVLLQAMQINDSDRAFVYSITAALLGVLLNLVFVHLQRRVLWWHSSVRTGGAA
ncbi:ABC transporter permease [Nocardioides marmotae]|uniref:ABC transporter permease subunit n=1 Tax=Nocardioides marmotae TaxID=2663857 RepID=A0A6I3J8P8_9ACTN|nr:ABC transporter permease subunit [Nocardioides marmotae]MCR6029920.1 ABC transporter permease subunit [Gordonia jinghuaiqii]MBC9732876.1 ABC transporter permease subunit [Nocardioides marmotae]MTB83990.1 ABC transporter permease subunit [Nocardioides marmotae]MTB93550.1 ABC transporter permease subunit [Nocardioides marmotae]QKD99920.1 ABC transporter permease subunit [Nocardioides marmotae]